MKSQKETFDIFDSVHKLPDEASSKDNKNDGILPTIGQVITPQGEAKDLEVDDEVLVPLVEIPPPPGIRRL